MLSGRPARMMTPAVMACATLLPPAAAALLAPPASATTGIVARSGSAPAVGNDVSWPQCPGGAGVTPPRSSGLPMPPSSARFVVIGLNDGLGFRANPCLARQSAWAQAHHVFTAAYAMARYPTAAQVRAYGTVGPFKGTSSATRLANTGYAQARFNLTSMGRARLVSQFIWVDVELYRTQPWSRSTTANKAVVDGALRGYRAAGHKVGFYSTKGLWASILGSARYRMPEWRTAGSSSAATARGRWASSYSFQGGRSALTQWGNASRDNDMTCPSHNTPSLLTTYFHKY